MKSTLRISCCCWFVLGTVLSQAQDALEYKRKVANPQANYYAIAAETDFPSRRVSASGPCATKA